MNGQAFKMNVDQFKQSLIDMGYRETTAYNNFEVFKKRNKRIVIYCGGDYYSVYYDKQVKYGTIEYNQHSVDFAKALANIKKFERKIGR